MTNSDSDKAHKRTAVLVVHGIGSQRALETVRGVIQGGLAKPQKSRRQGQADLEPSSTGRRGYRPDGHDDQRRCRNSKDKRVVDFHELYWAHLMSETKAVAVLLWLYELCRKGPIMKDGMNGLWWAACHLPVPDESRSGRAGAAKAVYLFVAECSVQNHADRAVSAASQQPVVGPLHRLAWQGLPSRQAAGMVLASVGVIVIAGLFRRRDYLRRAASNSLTSPRLVAVGCASYRACAACHRSRHGTTGCRAPSGGRC